jgi:hypothetical protein
MRFQYENAKLVLDQSLAAIEAQPAITAKMALLRAKYQKVPVVCPRERNSHDCVVVCIF